MDSDARGSDVVELPMDNRAGVVVAVVSTVIPLTGLVVAMRFYARQRLDNWIGLDDWAVLVSTVSRKHQPSRCKAVRVGR